MLESFKMVYLEKKALMFYNQGFLNLRAKNYFLPLG